MSRAVISRRSAFSTGAGNSSAAIASSQMDCDGMALLASAPLHDTMRPPSILGLTNVAPNWPFSALQTGNSASGVNKKSGSAWFSR